MSDNNGLEYCPVHARFAEWPAERDEILTQRQRFLPDCNSEQADDTSALHYLAIAGDEVAGYLRISAEGKLGIQGTRKENAANIIEALLRQAVLDSPRRGLSRLTATDNHPWHDALLQLGFAASSSPDAHTLALLLPPDRSHIASGSELVRLEYAADFQQFSVQLAQDAARSIAIFSEDLEAWLYDRDEFVSAVLGLAQKSRNSSIRIIVRDTRALLEHGHRLLRACQRASDRIQIRKLPTTQAERHPCYMLVDNKGLLFRQDPQVMQGIGYNDYRARVKPLLEQFELLWERSHIDSDLRQHTV